MNLSFVSLFFRTKAFMVFGDIKHRKVFNGSGYVPHFGSMDYGSFAMGSIGVPLWEHYGLPKVKSMLVCLEEAGRRRVSSVAMKSSGGNFCASSIHGVMKRAKAKGAPTVAWEPTLDVQEFF